MKPTNEKLAADILSAGKKEFLEKGFQGASMRSIACGDDRSNLSLLHRQRSHL